MDDMNDTTPIVTLVVYSFFALCFLIWFYFPSQPAISEARHDHLTTFPPAPPRPCRPGPKYITLVDLAKKFDAPMSSWPNGYQRENGMPAQMAPVATYQAPTRNFYTSPAVQRGRWEALSAAASPPPPPAYHPERYATSLAIFSASLRAAAAEPPFIPPQGLQVALRARQPPPFVFPRPKGPPSYWQGPAVYANDPLLPRPDLPPLPRAVDRWPPLLPRQRFGADASRFTETAVAVPPLVSFAQYARVEKRPSGRNFL